MIELESSQDWFTYTAPPCKCGHERSKHKFVPVRTHKVWRLICRKCECVEYMEGS